MLEFITYLSFFIIVLFLARFTVKWISKSFAMPKGGHMTVLERTVIDKGKSLVLLKAGDQVYLLGFTEQDITVIDTLDPKEVEVTVKENSRQKATTPGSFEQTLSKVLKEGKLKLDKVKGGVGNHKN